MCRSATLTFAFVTFLLAVLGTAVATELPDDVLAASREVTLTRADYEAALQRIPEDKRLPFTASATRLTSFVNSLLVTRTLAARARAAGLSPEAGMPNDTPNDIERALAAAQIKAMDAEAGQAFDAKRKGFEAAARENYLLHQDRYVRPPQVRLSAILIASEGRGAEAALALAQTTRERLVAGEDFAAVAREVSDEKVSAERGGQLDWRAAKQLDPALAKAASALASVGDISQPILQPIGYVLIRLDDRRPAGRMSFDEAQPFIMVQLRADYVTHERELVDQAIRNDPTLQVNQQALDSLVFQVDPELFRPPAFPGGGETQTGAR